MTTIQRCDNQPTIQEILFETVITISGRLSVVDLICPEWAHYSGGTSISNSIYHRHCVHQTKDVVSLLRYCVIFEDFYVFLSNFAKNSNQFQRTGPWGGSEKVLSACGCAVCAAPFTAKLLSILHLLENLRISSSQQPLKQQNGVDGLSPNDLSNGESETFESYSPSSIGISCGIEPSHDEETSTTDISTNKCDTVSSNATSESSNTDTPSTSCSASLTNLLSGSNSMESNDGKDIVRPIESSKKKNVYEALSEKELRSCASMARLYLLPGINFTVSESCLLTQNKDDWVRSFPNFKQIDTALSKDTSSKAVESVDQGQNSCELSLLKRCLASSNSPQFSSTLNEATSNSNSDHSQSLLTVDSCILSILQSNSQQQQQSAANINCSPRLENSPQHTSLPSLNLKENGSASNGIHNNDLNTTLQQSANLLLEQPNLSLMKQMLPAHQCWNSSSSGVPTRDDMSGSGDSKGMNNDEARTEDIQMLVDILEEIRTTIENSGNGISDGVSPSNSQNDLSVKQEELPIQLDTTKINGSDLLQNLINLNNLSNQNPVSLLNHEKEDLLLAPSISGCNEKSYPKSAGRSGMLTFWPTSLKGLNSVLSNLEPIDDNEQVDGLNSQQRQETSNGGTSDSRINRKTKSAGKRRKLAPKDISRSQLDLSVLPSEYGVSNNTSPYSPADLVTPCQGVCWDPTHQRWVAHWSDSVSHQRIRKYFNPKAMGFERARLLAIMTRKEAVDSGRASMMVKSDRQPKWANCGKDSAPNNAPPSAVVSSTQVFSAGSSESSPSSTIMQISSPNNFTLEPTLLSSASQHSLSQWSVEDRQ